MQCRSRSTYQGYYVDLEGSGARAGDKELKVQEYLSRNGGRHCISSTQAHVGLRCFFYIKRGIFNSGNLICHLAIVIIFLYISKFYLNYRVRYVVGAVTYFRGVGGRERERVGPWQMVAA